MSDTLQKMRDAYWEGTPDIDDGPMNATERASWEAAARVLLEDMARANREGTRVHGFAPPLTVYALSIGIDLSEQPEPDQK